MNKVKISKIFLSVLLICCSISSVQAQNFRTGFEIQGRSPYYFLNHPFYPTENKVYLNDYRNISLTLFYFFSDNYSIKTSYGYHRYGYNYVDAPPATTNSKRLSHANMKYLDISMMRTFRKESRIKVSCGLGLVGRKSKFAYKLGNYHFEPFIHYEPWNTDFGLIATINMKVLPIKNQRFWISLNTDYQKFQKIDTWSNSFGVGFYLFRIKEVSKEL